MFQRHLRIHHKIKNISSYIVMVFLGGIWPTCKCGCGGRVSWGNGDKRHKEKIEAGFGDFIHGHFIKLNNPNDDKNILEIKSRKQKQFWTALQEDPIAYAERCELHREASENMSEEGRANIVRAADSPERKQKLSEANKGKIHSKEWRENSSKAIKKFWDEHPERKEQKSLEQAERIMSGEIWKTYNKGKASVLKCINHDIISFRSSYEWQYIKELEEDEGVKNYLFEGIKIPYLYKENRKLFIVDFVVNYTDGRTVFVEVKNDWLLTKNKTKAKIAALEEYVVKRGFHYSILSNSYFSP